MHTTIFYFSATGNSLKAARTLAAKLTNTSCVSIPKVAHKPIKVTSERIGIVCPVYAWGLPLIVKRFIAKLELSKVKYCFVALTCGSFIGGTLYQTKKLLAKRAILLNCGFKIIMPGNYTPLYEAGSEESQQETFIKADKTLDSIVSKIKGNETIKIKRGILLPYFILTGLLYFLFLKNVNSSDKKFYVTDKCNGCGICKKVCPVKNIEMKDSKPVWQHKCEQCMACLQWCPEEAVQFGKKTIGRKRYRHPEVSLENIIVSG